MDSQDDQNVVRKNIDFRRRQHFRRYEGDDLEDHNKENLFYEVHPRNAPLANCALSLVRSKGVKCTEHSKPNRSRSTYEGVVLHNL